MSEQVNGPDWICETHAAAWQARDSQGEFVHDGHMWILGGWFASNLPNPRDVWKSCDGRQWTRVLEIAPWEHSDLPASVSFQGKMWLMGGRSVPGTAVSNIVWSSTDGAHWSLERQSAEWSPRLSMGHCVFRDRIWILGGTEDFYNHNETTMHHDVWSSAEGRTWKLETQDAGWSRRAHGQVLVFQDKMWMIGGGSWSPLYVPTNEVWCSEDGVNWHQVTAAASWEPRIWFSCAVYRNCMWLFGGWSKSHGNYNDVWYSRDGCTWNQLHSRNIWSPRHEQATYVFDDRIFLAGGEAQPLSNEVWSLHLPEAW